jgi:hypothetical protein
MIESILLTAVLMTSQKPLMPAHPMPVAAISDPNQTGFQRSAYKGKYFRESMEPYRKCVAYHEARYQYWTTGGNGRYHSTYQMTGALVEGAAWMITPELKKIYGRDTALKIRDTLLNTPGKKWARYYMDMAFWTVLNWEGHGSGLHHWDAQRHRCHTNMTHWEP